VARKNTVLRLHSNDIHHAHQPTYRHLQVVIVLYICFLNFSFMPPLTIGGGILSMYLMEGVYKYSLSEWELQYT